MHDGVSVISCKHRGHEAGSAAESHSQRGSVQLVKKGADLRLVKDDGAVSFLSGLQAGDHPDAGL